MQHLAQMFPDCSRYPEDPTSLVINNLTISEVSLLELMSIWEVEALRPFNVGRDNHLENVLDSNRRLGLHCV